MTLRILAVSLLALSACAALQQGLKDATDGIQPDLKLVPEGQGWFCYSSSDLAWNGCWRTKEECFSNWDKNKSDAKNNADTANIKFGECQPAVQASCLTYEEGQDQPNGSMKFVPVAECSPDSVSCGTFAEALKNRGPAKASRVSSCATVK